MKGRLTFLGTGASVGVPMIGCDCSICRSNSPYNHRLRTSVFLEYGSTKFLIDVGPDFRQQALREGISSFDGILFTHAHQDHTAGIDDLRPIYFKKPHPMPILLSSETAADIKERFSYFFQPKISSEEHFVERFELHYLPSDFGTYVFEGVPIKYMTYSQGGMKVNGYRIGDFAYLTDIKNYSEEIFEHLEGVKYLVLSSLRMTPSHVHFNVDESIDFSRKVKAKHTWLTHLSHELDYEHTNSYLPPNVRMAYDGLKIDIG